MSDDELGLIAIGRIVLITGALRTRPGELFFVDEFFCSDQCERHA